MRADDEAQDVRNKNATACLVREQGAGCGGGVRERQTKVLCQCFVPLVVRADVAYATPAIRGTGRSVGESFFAESKGFAVGREDLEYPSSGGNGSGSTGAASQSFLALLARTCRCVSVSDRGRWWPATLAVAISSGSRLYHWAVIL